MNSVSLLVFCILYRETRAKFTPQNPHPLCSLRQFHTISLKQHGRRKLIRPRKLQRGECHVYTPPTCLRWTPKLQNSGWTNRSWQPGQNCPPAHTHTHALSHTHRTHTRACTQPYFTINPSMFDHATWDYRSLQKLCKTLGLKQTGTKQKLISRLQTFHHEHRSNRFGAGAFANIGVQVYSSPTKSRTRVKREFLSPMVSRATGSPILKKRSSFVDADCYDDDLSSQGLASTARTPIRSTSHSSCKPRSTARKICFSPYNQVHIIPHRLDLKSPVRAMDLDDDL